MNKLIKSSLEPLNSIERMCEKGRAVTSSNLYRMLAVLLLGSNDSLNLGGAAKAFAPAECEPHDNALALRRRGKRRLLERRRRYTGNKRDHFRSPLWER